MAEQNKPQQPENQPEAKNEQKNTEAMQQEGAVAPGVVPGSENAKEVAQNTDQAAKGDSSEAKAPTPEKIEAYQPAFLKGGIPDVTKVAAPGVVPSQNQGAQGQPGQKRVVESKSIGFGTIFGCLGFFGFLFAALVTLLVVGSNTNAALFSFLGIQQGEVAQILRGLVNLSFGIFSIIVLIVFIINIFSLLLAKKAEKKKKKKASTGALIAFIVLVISLGSWFFVNASINVPAASPSTQSVLAISEKNEATGEWERITNTVNLVAPIELQFDSRVAIPQETEFYRILRYEWDLDGDGKFTPEEGAGPVASYTYTRFGQTGGLYDVTLRVTREILQPTQGFKAGDKTTDVFGPGSTNRAATVTIVAIKPTIKVVTVPQVLSGAAPLKIDFDASDTTDDKTVTSIEWDIDGDDVYELSGPKQTHVFDKIGNYDVKVRATDSEGLVAVKLLEVSVGETALPTATIDASVLSGDAPLKVKFDASNSTTGQGRITRYEWDFSDGSDTMVGEQVEHTFARAGKYTVTLTVNTDLDTTSQATQIIDVSTARGAPDARIQATIQGTNEKITSEAGNRISGTIPLEVEFDGSFSTDPERDLTSWRWDFDGDQQFDTTGETVSYTYQTPGKYVATLQVQDSAGNVDEASINVEVTASELFAAISADPKSGEVPLEVAFDGSGSGYAKGEIASYTWDFGDGTSPQITGAIINHTFSTPGNYVVSLTVTTTDGKIATTKQSISVLQESLIPSFTVVPDTGRAPLTVRFDGTATKGKVVSYRWDFGNGQTDTGIRTQYKYETPGSYTVTLRVQDINGNQQSTTRVVTVAE